MRQRGAALPTVLALVTAVLVIGLAMGSLSTLSLQFNRRQLEAMRSEMAARSAVAHLLAKLREHDAEARLNPLQPEAVDIKEILGDRLEYVEGAYRVKVHFHLDDEGFSTDNLGGDSPAVGWADVDDVPRVQPFGLDVVLNVEGPGLKQRYRVGLRRVWPFALYSARGPLAMISIPAGHGQPAAPTIVKGDAYTNWQGEATDFGEDDQAGFTRTGYGLGKLDDPSKVLANFEARAGWQPARPPNFHLLVGMELGYNAPKKPTDVDPTSTLDEKFYFYGLDKLKREFNQTETEANFSPTALIDADTGNELDGDFLYNHKLDADIAPYVHHGSKITGRSSVHRGPALDPLKDITPDSEAPAAGLEDEHFSPLILHPPDQDLENLYGLDPAMLQYDDGSPDSSKPQPYLLDSELVLTPDENSVDPSNHSTHYVIDRSVSNRQVVYNMGGGGRGPGVYVREKRAGIRLQNTVLHVKGDLDLSSTELDEVPEDPDHPGLEIVGAGATLIVDGQLILGNAHINAQDQGFVLYARDIVLKGGGTFYGLMIAENSISILSQKNDLEIKGALMCAGPGGITLKGTRLEHDPDYLKSINGGGDFGIMSWSKIETD